MVFTKGKKKIYWYRFKFAGRDVRGSTKSTSKTVAEAAEKQRRRELEEGYNNARVVRSSRVRLLKDVIDDYLVGYRLRYRAARFAEYALGHVSRLLGRMTLIEIDDNTVLRYQENRLREKAAPKSINEEVRFLVSLLGDSGELIRQRLKKKKQFKLRVDKNIGKAYDFAETSRLAERSTKSRSAHMHFAFMLARNAGLRDTEIKTLTWGRINLILRTVQVGRAKTEAGEGRIVPMNAEVYAAAVAHRARYLKRFHETREEWFVFPWGKPQPKDPTRHVTSLKTAWKNMRTKAEVKGRWHDNRHSLITELAESGAGDETILGIAGHVDRKMLSHYSHIRVQAKRNALEAAITVRKTNSEQNIAPS